MKIPGAVWSGILVALALLPVWLGDSFPGAIWAAPVAGLLTIAAKVIEVMVAGDKEQVMAPGVNMESFSAAPAPQPSKTRRFLLG